MRVSLSYFAFDVQLSSKQVLPYSMLFLRTVSGKENLDFLVKKQSPGTHFCVFFDTRDMGTQLRLDQKFFSQKFKCDYHDTKSQDKKELYVVQLIISFQSKNQTSSACPALSACDGSHGGDLVMVAVITEPLVYIQSLGSVTIAFYSSMNY